MGFKRFVAYTTREAMAQVRRELGDDAVILSNKRIAGGQIEILAAAPEAVDAIAEEVRQPARASNARKPNGVETFQDYLRRQGGVSTAPQAQAQAQGSAARANAQRGDAARAKPMTQTSRHMSVPVPAPTRMYEEIASSDDGDFNESLPEAWQPTSFGAPAAQNTRVPQRAPQAQSAPVQRPQPAAEPAVFRRRPARAVTQPLPTMAEPFANTVQPAVQSMAPAYPAMPMNAAPYPAAPAYLPVPTLQPGMQPMQQLIQQPMQQPMQQTLHPSMMQPTPQPMLTPMPQPVAQQAMPQPAVVAAPVIVQAPVAPAVSSTPAAPATLNTAARPSFHVPSPRQEPAAVATAVAAPAPAPAPAPTPVIDLEPAPARAAGPTDGALLAELQSLRSALQEQLATISTSVAASDNARRHPLQTRLMTRMLTAGFSADVARRISAHAPTQGEPAVGEEWLQSVLATNLRCANEADSIIEKGGVYALVGPTGVGKTTTTAKLAARFAVKYGTSALGLITLDAYRIAAHEQLRTYGRILGTPVHLAQDAAALRELLGAMKNKKLVLIDTCGVSPRDERLPELLAMLSQASSGSMPIQPVLLLNAASHAETLEDTARAWRASRAVGTILTKIDEAARIGGALDCALRYKLTLLGLTNGQRVPEDWHLANPRLLAHLALKPASQLFAMADGEGALLAQERNDTRNAALAKARGTQAAGVARV